TAPDAAPQASDAQPTIRTAPRPPGPPQAQNAHPHEPAPDPARPRGWGPRATPVPYAWFV
ncbi:hypothetical protein ACPF8X_43820, partial [Streptomyces sp. G35A]